MVRPILAPLFFVLSAAALLSCAAAHLRHEHGCQFARHGSPLAAMVDIRPWGQDSIRVRLPLGGSSAVRDDLPGALIPPPTAGSAEAGHVHGDTAGMSCDSKDPGASGSVTSGNLKVDVSSAGLLTFTRLSDNKVVLQETEFTAKQSAEFSDLAAISQSFHADASEMIFGFGEHENGKLNQKGLSYDFEQCLEYGHSRGGEVCLPFILGYTPVVAAELNDSAAGSPAAAACLDYGLLWNMPGYGSVAFGANATVWTASAAAQLDFFVTVAAAASVGARCNADISEHYVDATGHSPLLPEWAAGYWHSKNRYASQSELLAAAKRFHDLEIPVDVIVIDYHHWTHMGDWSFDPHAWPDPQAMVDTVQSAYGMRIMVSVWPFSMTASSSFATINASGYGVQNGSRGADLFWPDGTCGGQCYLYDPTQPAARQYVWSRVQAGYLRYGIHVFWLDASEPENMGGTPRGAHYKAGPAEQVGMTFPLYHARTMHDGQLAAGQAPINLLRSGWAGQQRYGGAVWSGDTRSTFATLEHSIRAGLNIQLSGIAWWTTDVGGYAGGDPKDAQFNELIVRWFQYGATCPLLRQHGARPTEPWLLSNGSCALVVALIRLRAAWRPYVMDAMARVNATGLPVQRPLWYDFPADPRAWAVEDQYLFGSGLMAAPVYAYRARSRSVYFPAGEKWQHYFTNETYEGGGSRTVAAPLDTFPLFRRLTTAAWEDPVPIN